MKTLKAFSLLILSTLALVACSSSSSDSKTGDSGDVSPQGTPRLDWGSIPAEFHPETKDTNFRTDSIERINLSLFGANDDVEVIYSNDLAADTGFVRIYSVWKKSAKFGSTNISTSGKTLNVANYGEYECSIQTENGKITELEGGCYVRVQLVLPTGATIEVYSLNQLISKRFIAMDNESFIKAIKNATWAKDKLVVIDDFLKSYVETSRTPSLTSDQTGLVVHEFSYKEEKYDALRKLQAYVSDRGNLRKMIEKEFSYFDQDEARRIVGL